MSVGAIKTPPDSWIWCRCTMVTPPTSVHSHHNEGGRLANWLITQDGGIHYHCRTMGFRFEEPVHR